MVRMQTLAHRWGPIEQGFLALFRPLQRSSSDKKNDRRQPRQWCHYAAMETLIL